MTTELATTPHGNALAVTDEAGYWNDQQLAALRQLGVDRASNGDLAVFHHVCQATGLDPFARQIYMIEREGKQTIQTGIDGFRLVARRSVDRTKETLSIGAPEWCGPDGQWTDVWLHSEPPAAARVVVRRGNGEFPAIALWREYVQTKRNGEITRMWATRPAGQLAKCAEALALRKAFPQDLSGVYTDDEMAHSQVVEGAVVQAQQHRRVTASDLTGDAPPPDEPPAVDQSEHTAGSITKAQLTKLHTVLTNVGMGGPTNRDEALAYYERVTGREVESSKELSRWEASQIIEDLQRAERGEPNRLDPASANDPAFDERDGGDQP
jgi:phage recombination protein Bet